MMLPPHLPCLLVLSIREAVFIVSPKMENLGILDPIRPVTQGPVWRPMRTYVGNMLTIYKSYKATCFI